MCTYLAKRGATYYFRHPIPKALQSHFGGSAAFMVSLRTKDRESAKALLPDHTKTAQAALAKARASLSSGVASPSTQHLTHEQIREHDRADREVESAAFWEAEDDAREERRKARREYDRLLRRRMALSTAELTPEEAAIKDLISEAKFDATIAREQLVSFRASIDAEREERGLPPRARSSRASADQPLRRQVGGRAQVAVQHQGMSLTDSLVDLWAAERRPTAKTKAAHEAVARWFVERVGEKSVEQITRADVLAFKDALLAEGTSAANTNTKLSRLRTLLGWAMQNDHAEVNVAVGIRVKDALAQRNKRKPFDLATLNVIFTSPVYASDERPIRGRLEASYWLPLLALYTGARLEELGQLRTGDLRQVTYAGVDDAAATAWMLNITEDETDGLQLKNAASERLIPLHYELERLGFVAYVRSVELLGASRIFPDLRPGAFERLTAKWGEWFSLYLRKVCGVTDKRLVFHSFRHSFKDHCRHLGISQEVQLAIMGHSGSEAADGYGDGCSLHQLVEGMKQYRVPGFQLPQPPPSFRIVSEGS